MATTNALLGTARLNNFRLNYLTAAVAEARRTKVQIVLGGEDVRGRTRRGSVTIRDVINDAPNTAALALEAPPQQYAAAVLVDAPIAYWRLGDVTPTAYDQTGRLHAGTLVGAITINVGGAIDDGDRAMHFPGVVNARIEVAAAADLALTDSVAVEAWVKTESVSQQGGILEKTIGGAVNTSYVLFQDGGAWIFRIIGSFGSLAVTVPVDAADVGNWVYLVGVFIASYARVWLFRNGIQVATSPVPAGTLSAGAGVLTIGHLGTYGGARIYPFAGAIDEVAVYPVLVGSQIAQHYAQAHRRQPTVGQALRISVGVDAPVLLFNGAVAQVALTYEGRPAQTIYHCAATDDTARANRRRPFGQWTNVSATTVAQQLIAQFVPGFGSAFVQAGLPPVSVIFDGSEGMNRCLTQITNLIGGYWYFLDSQLHLFLTEATDAPDPIDDTPQRFLNDPPIAAATEMSQVRTRVYGRGHGENLLSAVAATETILPIADTTMFSASGGQANCLAQVLTYTGRDLGGDGSLVGPGAGPSVAATATIAGGPGLASGVYQYAYTNVTAAGESLPGPIAVITTGVYGSPRDPVLLISPTIGSGPDPGSHDWAVTFVTAVGETTPGPRATGATGLTAAPTTTLTVAVNQGAGLDLGVHDYVVTFVTAIGETTPSPVSGPVTTSMVAGYTVSPPSETPVARAANLNSSNLAAGDLVYYAFTYLTANGGETTIGPASNTIVIAMGPSSVPNGGIVQAPALVSGATGVACYRNRNGTWDQRINAGPGGNSIDNGLNNHVGSPPGTNTATVPPIYTQQVFVQNLPISVSADVTARKLYRRFNGTGPHHLVVTIPNNTAATYTDTTPNASLGAAAPAVSTAYLQRLALTVIPIGGPLVTSRKIYRTAAGGTQLKLVGTITDNTTKNWLDTVTDALLGANAPIVNTAVANQVALSGIAIGATPVTARKIYRTAVNGAQLKLLATIADNVTLTYLDTAGDGVLGTNVPTGDTSALTQPQGQVNAGSATLPTASAGPFRTSGGWVILGSQFVRYTGISGNTLTGLPPSGIGALITTVRYGDHILAAPVLTGVTVPGGLTAPAGTLVTIWVQRDDVPAQTAMAARDGGDGIYEYLVQDERRTEASLTALCDAHLLAYKAPIATVTYATRDLKTKSGKPVVVGVESPPIAGTLVIQDVTIDEIDLAPGLAPRFTVTASTVRLSLDDLLRQLAGTLETTA